MLIRTKFKSTSRILAEEERRGRRDKDCQQKSFASSIEILNAFLKGASVIRTAAGQIGKKPIGPIIISWRNVWEETGRLPSRGRLSVYFFSFLDSMAILLRKRMELLDLIISGTQ